MKLSNFKYEANKGLANEIQIKKHGLNYLNLIVGKNASGKSKIVQAVYELSELLAKNKSINFQAKNQSWHLVFDADLPQQKIEYALEISKNGVKKEQLTVYSESCIPVIARDESGKCAIWAKELNQYIQFQIDKTEIAVVKYRDSIQHPFIEALHQWSKSLRFYDFGAGINENLNTLVETFARGQDEIGDDFDQSIISDMSKIGYNIVEFDLKILPLSSPNRLYIKEMDLCLPSEASLLSQGMLQALSLFAQVNYYLLTKNPGIIVIDNLGQGLDYRRSLAIARMLLQKSKTDTTQLILTTNNQFVMNIIPLQYWLITKRDRGRLTVSNLSSKKLGEFKDIGITNFDLFSSDLL